MRINVEIIPQPEVTSFTMYADIDPKIIEQTKEITVSSHFQSKTRVSTAIQVSNARMGTNFKIDGFKTAEVKSYSYFSSENTISNYFVVSKKQALSEYIEYVKKVVSEVIVIFGLNLDEITIKLIKPKF
jgi:hypothetical protein